ncbi:DUF4332 domain-containing protein [bacterium]|nr:DUF4332 domain-containing protein [bacterium]
MATPTPQVENAAGVVPGKVRRQGIAHVICGAGILVMAFVGLWRDVSWLAQPFYAWAWWGYILILDGYAAIARGDSLLTTRWKYFVPICTWSITFWFFFELINARIRNWYYVGVFPYDEWLAGGVFTVAAFATVFMGIFTTVDALGASGLWSTWRGPRRQFPRRLTYTLQFIGGTTAALALLFPYYLAPLVWGSFTLIVDPWNYRRGARSLLRDLEDGNYGLLARLLLAGLICGVVWESLNFFAPQKWIYTVRGLEGFKLFEMPMIGFLGFPALALDSMAGYAMFASWLLGNRTWEHPQDLTYQPTFHPARSTSVFVATVVVQMLFWAAVSGLATPINVASIQVQMSDLGLSRPEVQKLETLGITRPRQLLHAATDTEERPELQSTLHWDNQRLTHILERTELYTFKGIGRDHGQMLESIGIHSPTDFRHWDPEKLEDRLAKLPAPLLVTRPRLDFVKVWILAAKSPTAVVSVP